MKCTEKIKQLSRRSFWNSKTSIIKNSVFVIAASMMVSSSCQQVEKVKKKRPNVLFIAVDDLRPELGCYGNKEIITPNFDKLAGEGILFSNTFCQAAVCAPSRASLMTGLRPDSSRVWHLGDEFREINPDVVTMPQYFKKYGYHTVSMGKIFHNHMPDSVSFDEPDLRPAEYSTPDMIARDAESFHHDPVIKEQQRKAREVRKMKNPNKKLYADGWGYGQSVENFDAPDNAFYDGAQTDLAIETLKRLKDKDEPFFFALGYYRPHLPFIAPKKYWDMYNVDSIALASNPYLPEGSPAMAMNSAYELRACSDMKYVKHPSAFQLSQDSARVLKHGYYASVSYIDACLGKLMDGLKELGLDENTIVIVYGDHGWKLGEHGSWGKQTNYKIDTHVPLIIKAPNSKAKGVMSSGLTELVDIYPTLLDLSGIDVPEYLQGTSLKPLLDHPDLPWKNAVFSQFHRRPRISLDGKRYMGYSMTTNQYNYVEWHYWDNENKVPGELIATELYDHIADPEENLNIADKVDEQLIQQLAAQLEGGWREARPKNL